MAKGGRCALSSKLPKMSVLAVLAVLGFCGYAQGEFIVTHAPDYLRFADKDSVGAISTSDIPKLITSSFGYSVSKDAEWDGLKQTSMFRRPKASVLVSVDGYEQTLNLNNLARYASNADDGDVDTQAVVDSIQAVASDSQPLLVDFSVDNTIFDVKSHYPELFKNLPGTYGRVKELFVSGAAFSPSQLGSLNISQDADLLFLGELHVIRQITATLKSRRDLTKGKVPDFYHFKISGMAQLSKAYGPDSSQLRDAHALLETVLNMVTKEFKEMYSNNVVVQVVSLPAIQHQAKQRHTRGLLEDKPQDNPENNAEVNPAADDDIEKTIGYAEDWSADFPVVFNIILWTMVLLIIAVTVVAVGMWHMDPGRDSIIYRMTSQRMKKD